MDQSPNFETRDYNTAGRKCQGNIPRHCSRRKLLGKEAQSTGNRRTAKHKGIISNCTAKVIINTVKRNLTGWEHVQATFPTKDQNSGCTSNFKNSTETINPVRKLAKDHNRQFSQEIIQMSKVRKIQRQILLCCVIGCS